MAARGNRITGVGRCGVAFLATAVVALAAIQPAFAESSPPPPTEATNPDAAPTPSTPPSSSADRTESSPAPADQAPTPKESSTESAPTPRADSTEADADADAEARAGARRRGRAPIPPPPRRHPTRPSLHRRCPRTRSSSSPPRRLRPRRRLRAPTPAPAAPAAPSGAPPAVVVVLQDTPAPAAAAADDEAAKEEAAVAAAVAIVSFKPRPAPAAISLLPTDDTAVAAPQKKTGADRAAGKRLVRPATCARPTARVPLSQRCRQVRAVASLQVTLTYAATASSEARAAIARTAARLTIRRVESRPPPKSKAAKKRPIAEARPIVPFGDSGQGVTNDGFSGSSGSVSSSRLFALAAVPLRVPLPSRFARVRLPSTRPDGVIPAPPSARPG